MKRAAAAPIALSALLLTLLTAAKPLVIDEAAYHAYARQIAEQPADPFGFEIFWMVRPEPANHLLTSAVLVYWWGGALALWGDHPVAWKLSLLPFALLLAAALWSLFRRFAPGIEAPLLWMTMLSPPLLQGFNLMPDVPALALGMTALAAFMRACDRDSLAAAAGAGLLAGLAMQTKYTGVLAAGAIALYAVVYRRIAYGFLAGALASAVFASWELVTALHYGESHFLHAWTVMRELPPRPVAGWTLGLLSILGATSPALGLLGLAALGVRSSLLTAGCVAVPLAFAALALLPQTPVAAVHAVPDPSKLAPELWLFVPLGLMVVATTARVSWRLLRAGPRSDERLRIGRAELFLIGWLVLEIVFLESSRFLAARRVIPLSVVLTLLAARLATRTPAPPAASSMRRIAACAVGLGILFAASELADAVARRSAVDLARNQLTGLGADREQESVWFVGHWGFQFHAERDGMRQLVPGRSRLRRGDWIVVAHGANAPPLRNTAGLERIPGGVAVQGSWPWSTIPGAYGGAIPIRRQPASQMRLVFYRVDADLMPTSPSRQRD